MKTVFENNALKLFEDDEEIGNIVLGKQSESVFRILRVFVVEEKRNMGIASFMMKQLVAFAKEKNFLLVPVCSYAVIFFKRHKEFEDVVFKV